MIPKLDIPLSSAIISNQLNHQRALQILAIISSEIQDFAFGTILVQSITRDSLFVDKGQEYPSLIVLAPQEPGIKTSDILEALHASQPIIVIEEFEKERYSTVTFSHRALLGTEDAFPRSEHIQHSFPKLDKDKLKDRINARLYQAQPSGKSFSFLTRSMHQFIVSSH